jgi:hypothetical protein
MRRTRQDQIRIADRAPERRSRTSLARASRQKVTTLRVRIDGGSDFLERPTSWKGSRALRGWPLRVRRRYQTGASDRVLAPSRLSIAASRASRNAPGHPETTRRRELAGSVAIMPVFAGASLDCNSKATARAARRRAAAAEAAAVASFKLGKPSARQNADRARPRRAQRARKLRRCPSV